MKEILVTESVALSGISEIIDKKISEISKKYPDRIIKKAKPDVSFEKDMSGFFLPDHTFYGKPMGEGGFFAGLWYMADALKCGFTVDMRRVPVIQEVIEICEMYNVNPYILESKGAWLIVTDESEKQREIFLQNNINARFIGVIEESNDKKLICGERIRFLDRPAPDELRKFR